MRKGFVIHHNGPPANCVGRSHDRCVSFWRAVKRYHTETKGWSDIAYSFGVCPHGDLFSGRGWHRAQWANGSDQVGVNDGRDSDWYTVLAFVGGGAHGGYDTGSKEEPVTPEMGAGLRSLIQTGRSSEYCDRRVLPHNAFKRKACPGPTLTMCAARLDNGATTPPITNQEDDMATVLAHFRTKADSNDGMHTYRITGNLASWCGTHDEIRAAEFFGATWFGPLDPPVWRSMAVINGPLANQDRR